MLRLSKIVAVLNFILFLCFFIGCAPVSYDLPPNSEKVLKPQEKVTNTIKAAGPWRSSSVLVQKGNKYKISASGRWRTGGTPWDAWVGPDGIGANSLFNIVKGYTSATLIAKIGNGPPFAVGRSMLLQPSADGLLYFRMNDSSSGDCQGQVEVTTKNLASKKDLQITQSKPKVSDRLYENIGFKQNWAVIIGLSKYKYSGQNFLTNLIFADDDAKAFASVLRNLGWSESHIKLLINEEATKQNIEIALESWLTKAGPNDQIILFWAGHGFPDPENPEKVYFACYDTNIAIPATGYRMSYVRRSLEEKSTRNVIVLADTCHAGKLITRGERGISVVPNIEKMSRENKVPKGWIFMVGADTDRQAIEHTSWTNGAFTHSLIKGLSGEADGFQSAGVKDGVVTMGELKDYMNTAMPDETQKVLGVAKRPVITTSTGDPDIWNLTLQAK